jgi:peptidoglycan DL-endopeptidase CwlO
MAINGIALGALGIGGVFLYSAYKGKSVLASAQAVISGQSPSTVPVNESILSNPASATANDTSSVSTGISGSESGAAGDATKYVGHAYLYSGAPGLDGKQPWDCSSFANWVYGHDEGLAIPGYAAGTYTGAEHGPATTSWFFFGSEVNGIGNAQPGDAVVWVTHMGIYLGGNNLISALNPQLGTRITTVDNAAPFGEPMSIRRL